MTDTMDRNFNERQPRPQQGRRAGQPPVAGNEELLAELQSLREKTGQPRGTNMCSSTLWRCVDQITSGWPEHDKGKSDAEASYEWIGPIGGTPTCPVCGSTQAKNLN